VEIYRYLPYSYDDAIFFIEFKCNDIHQNIIYEMPMITATATESEQEEKSHLMQRKNKITIFVRKQITMSVVNATGISSPATTRAMKMVRCASYKNYQSTKGQLNSTVPKRKRIHATVTPVPYYCSYYCIYSVVLRLRTMVCGLV